MSDLYLKRKKRFENDPDADAFTSGGLLGATDELAGVGNALIGAIKKGSLSDFKSDYEKARDSERAILQRSQQQNPDRFRAINTAAQAPYALLPGGLPAQIAAGGLSGAMNSDKTGQGLIEDTAVGGGLSGLIGKLKVPGQLANKAVQAAKNIPIPQTVDMTAKLKALKNLAGDQLAGLYGEEDNE